MLICRQHVLDTCDVAEADGDDETAEYLHEGYDFVIAGTEEPGDEIVADGDEAAEHGNRQEPDEAIRAHHAGADCFIIFVGVRISDAGQHDRAEGSDDGQGHLDDFFGLFIIAIFQWRAGHDADHRLVEDRINLDGNLRQEHLDDDGEIPERLDFPSWYGDEVFWQIEPDREAGKDVHHTDKADVFVQIGWFVNQNEDKDNAGEFDDEIPQHDFTEFFQPLEKP